MPYNFTGDVTFKEQLIRVLEINELNGLSPYSLSWAGTPESGWSFGVVQYDIGALEFARNLFLDVLLNAKDANGNYIVLDSNSSTGRYHLDPITGQMIVEDTTVLDLFEKAQTAGGQGLTAAEQTLINAALQSSYGVQHIDESYNQYFDTELFPNKVDPVLAMATGPDLAFLQGALGRIFVIDFSNQYGSANVTRLKNFVAGQPVLTQRGGVIQKQGVLGVDDLLNFYFRTNNAQNLPWDPMRRFGNIVAETGYAPVDLDEAKGVLRAFTYLYVPNEDLLHGTEGRIAAVNEFRTRVCEPANNFVIDWLQNTYGMSLALSSYDSILMGDENDNVSDTGEYQLNGRDGNDIICGEGGNDTISGGVGEDILVGGAGNDMLYGGAGRDTYVGGEGYDQIYDEDGEDYYIYRTGDGLEKINDIGGVGQIRFDDAILRGGVGVNASGDGINNVYDSADGQFRYIRRGADIFVVKNDGQMSQSDIIVISNYEQGALSISLVEPAPFSFVNVILGDANAAPTNDNINGTADSNKIESLLGNDTVLGMAGDDEIFGGAGDDDLWGDGVDFVGGNDVIHGEDGDDLIGGDGGDDYLEGGAGRDVIHGDFRDDDAGDDVLLGGMDADALMGYAGLDLLDGGDGDDLLSGGAGIDVLYGGDGADYMWGDTNQIAQRGWWIGYTSPQPDYYVISTYNISTSMPSEANQGSDVLYGGLGNDFIFGDGGDDLLYGEGDNDVIEGGAGDDIVDGGDGDDFLAGDDDDYPLLTGNDTLYGGSGNDKLHGNAGDDTLYGGIGLDYLDGGLGADFLFGEDGDDQLLGGEGADFIDGGIGNDLAFGHAGNDILLGGAGLDELQGGDGDDTLEGGDDNDLLIGDGGADTLYGDAGDDSLQGNDGNDTLVGGLGSDRLWGDAGDDTLQGDDGNDFLLGGDGNDTLFGGADNDQLQGDLGMDTLFGEAGDDTLYGLGDDDLILGGDGNDSVVGGDGADQLYGEAGADIIHGEAGNDLLVGGAGDDVLRGGDGDDTLIGGEGFDYLFGDAGNDNYQFMRGDGTDIIEDTIGLDKLSLVGLNPNDVSFVYVDGGDLRVRINGTNDLADIRNWFNETGTSVDSLQFADGTVFGAAEVQAAMNYQSIVLGGSGGSTSITGSATGNNNIVINVNQTQPTQFLLDANNLSAEGYNWFTLQSSTSGSNMPIFTGFQIANNDLVMNWDIEVDGVAQGTNSALTVNNFFDIYTYPGTQFGFQSAKYTFVNEVAAIANPGVYVQTLGTMPLYLVREPNMLYYGINNMLFSGTTGDDVLTGESGINNVFYGKEGNDVLYGNRGDDTFVGGAGADTMYGGQGYDTYHISPTENDVIFDNGVGETYASNDTIRLPDGMQLANVSLSRQGDDLLIGSSRVIRYFERDNSTTDPSKLYPYMIEQLQGYDWRIYDLPAHLATLGLFGGISGTEGADNLVGDSYDNTIIGNGGDDFIDGEYGNDALFGGSGRDSVQGDYGNDRLYGGDGDDSLQGWFGNDLLEGGAGWDQMFGDAGDDVLRGSDGNDYLVGDDDNRAAWGNALSRDTLDGGVGEDVLVGGYDGDTYLVRRGDGYDIIQEHSTSGNHYATDLSRLDQELTSLETYTGTTYKNNYWWMNMPNGIDGGRSDFAWIPIETQDALTRLAAGVSVAEATTTLMDFRNLLLGTNVDAVVFGEGITPENIVVEWNEGGAYLDDWGLAREEVGRLGISFGEGQDVLEIESRDFGANFGIEEFRFADGRTFSLAEMLASDSTPSKIGAQPGTATNDVLIGSFTRDQLYGYEGRDVLFGGSEDDRLFGGLGDDILIGGRNKQYGDHQEGNAGSDVYAFNIGDSGLDAVGDYIFDFSGSPQSDVDTLSFGAGINPGDLDAYLEYTDNGNGAYYATLVLSLRGSGDTYYVDWFYEDGTGYVEDHRIERIQFLNGVNDRVFDLATLVTDRFAELRAATAAAPVQLFTSTALEQQYDITNQVGFAGGEHALHYALTGEVMPTPIPDAIIGTPGDDILAGTDTSDRMIGLAGNDVLQGLAGDDELQGDAGNDLLSGGAGNDTYFYNVGDGIDTIDDTNANGDTNRIIFGAGIDPASVTLGLGSLLIRAGNPGDEIHITQFDPNDPYGVHAIDSFEFADGTVLSYAEFLARGFDISGGAGNDTLTGTVLEDRIFGGDGDDQLDGGDGNDFLFGEAGMDTLSGGDGNDLLDGGLGADTLIGGLGDDTFVVDDPGDIVMEWTGEGTDTVQSAISYTLGDAIENLTLTGVAADGTGNAGDNILTGNAAANALTGLAGNDNLLGLDGKDTLVGGAGDDNLAGGSGDDTYLFNLGDGVDTIDDLSLLGEGNKLIFGAGITLADLVLSYSGDSMIVRVGAAGDAINLTNFDPNDVYGAHAVDTFHFADGLALSYADLIGPPSDWYDEYVGIGFEVTGSLYADSIFGTNAIDTIWGLDGDDVIRAGAGDDTVDGGNGNDILYVGSGWDDAEGGAGNDTFISSGDGGSSFSDVAGDDTYIIYRESFSSSFMDYVGIDTLVFPDVLPSEVSAEADYRLFLWLGESRIMMWGWQEGAITEKIQFADGTIWTVDDILAMVTTGTDGNDTLGGDYRANTIYGFDGIDHVRGNGGDDFIDGGAGNDTLYGDEGADILIGGIGNDRLGGIDGSDLYIFNSGDGADTINEWNYGQPGTDTLRFGAGIARADVDMYLVDRLYSDYDDFMLQVIGSTDSVLFDQWTQGVDHWIERIEFGDGSVIGYDELNGSDRRGTAAADTLNGDSYADRMFGDVGNDTLNGYAGNDSLNGGAGNDTLAGGTGSDWYLFTSGWGSDTIVENDATAGNIDNVAFGSGLGALDLVFSMDRRNLVVTRHGSTDSITVKDWDRGSVYQTEIFRAADAGTLLNTQVDQLIQAMATFSANNGGITWDQALDQQPQDVQAVLASYWQAPAA